MGRVASPRHGLLEGAGLRLARNLRRRHGALLFRGMVRRVGPSSTVLSAAMTALGLVVACSGDKVSGPNTEVAFVGLSGLPASGQLYVGQTLFVTATTYDRDHHLITGLAVTWVSSDTAAVAPWGTGVAVVGRAAGAVVITATSQGQSASASLTVRVVPVASVRITPASGATYVAMKTQLSATALDSSGHPLARRPVTWSSSDMHKATVDTAGQVTAVGGGIVTITATIEGKSASATVTILGRPTANWSGVTGEWVTYQGNASHTGYVPATLDPVVFSPAWESTVVSAVPLNPVTIGGGRIYVSTNAYFGVQQLHVLDAASGAQQWSYDFGGIHSVDPPAYDSGTVYVATGGHEDSFLWAFDAATGTQRFRTAYENQWSRWYAPVVVGQTLYMAGGYYGGMYAFSTTSGTEAWFVSLNQYDEFSPAVRDGLVYAYTGSYSPEVSVVDAATGAAVSQIPDSAFGWNGWSMNLAPVLGASNDLLATQAGRLLSFDLANRRIGWVLTGRFDGQVTLANGVVYVQNAGSVVARRESDGSLVWAWAPPDGTVQGTMIATQNLLFVSTGATTYALDLAARLQGWSYPAGGALALSKDGLLLIAQSNGKLAAIRVR